METKEIRRLGQRRMKAIADERHLSEALRPLVIDALREGARPGEIVELTGWSPAQVRIIARAAGLPPAKRGTAGKAARSSDTGH